MQSSCERTESRAPPRPKLMLGLMFAIGLSALCTSFLLGYPSILVVFQTPTKFTRVSSSDFSGLRGSSIVFAKNVVEDFDAHKPWRVVGLLRRPNWKDIDQTLTLCNEQMKSIRIRCEIVEDDDHNDHSHIDVLVFAPNARGDLSDITSTSSQASLLIELVPQLDRHEEAQFSALPLTPAVGKSDEDQPVTHVGIPALSFEHSDDCSGSDESSPCQDQGVQSPSTQNVLTVRFETLSVALRRHLLEHDGNVLCRALEKDRFVLFNVRCRKYEGSPIRTYQMLLDAPVLSLETDDDIATD